MNNIDLKKVGLFIDAENVSCVYLKEILEKTSIFGDVISKKAFAKFGSIDKSWSEINEVKLYNTVSINNQKNFTDMSMAVEVLDDVYKNDIDICCIATGDSDFLPLVLKLQELKKTVILFTIPNKSNQELLNTVNVFFSLQKENKKIETPEEKEKKKRLKEIKIKIDEIIKKNKKKGVKNITYHLVVGSIGTHYKPSKDFKEFKCSSLLDMLILLKYKIVKIDNEKMIQLED